MGLKSYFRCVWEMTFIEEDGNNCLRGTLRGVENKSNNNSDIMEEHNDKYALVFSVLTNLILQNQFLFCISLFRMRGFVFLSSRKINPLFSFKCDNL